MDNSIKTMKTAYINKNIESGNAFETVIEKVMEIRILSTQYNILDI